jgi:hypothetical protein
MAMSKRIKAQDSELTVDRVCEALQAQFPAYQVSLKQALIKYAQVDKSTFTGVAVNVRGGTINVFPQNGSFWVRLLVGWLVAYLTSGQLVDEVGGFLEQEFG